MSGESRQANTAALDAPRRYECGSAPVLVVSLANERETSVALGHKRPARAL